MIESANVSPMAAVAPRFDHGSKWFKLTLSVAFVWLLIASYFAWQRYQDNRPSELPVISESESRCFFSRLHFRENGEAIYEPPTPSEISDCLVLEAETDARIYRSSEEWAKTDAGKWFALWGLVVPLSLLLLVAVRVTLFAFAARAGQTYLRWLNSEQTH